MRIAHAEKSLPGEIHKAVGVVGNAAYLLDEFDFRKPTLQFRTQLLELAQQELMFALVFLAVVIGRYYHADADQFVVERNEPGPMTFSAIKDQRIPAGHAWVADRSGDLR